MTQKPTPLPAPGAIEWCDLTVPDASALRPFYEAVVGWEISEHPMGDYSDYTLARPGTDETVAGLCHARGPNQNLPPAWMIYVRVDDVEASAARCEELGGKILSGPREMGKDLYCAIQDPAGAVLSLVSAVNE